MQNEKSITLPGLINLVIVYILWGSTYLAIRVAVRQDGGFSPFVLGLSRVSVGGTVLLLWSAIRKNRIRLTRDEFITLLVSGLMLWVGGNGLLSWGEQRIESGLASLMIAAVPIWVAVVEAVLDRQIPSGRMIFSLAVGFSGIVILAVPTLRDGLAIDIVSIFILLLAGLSWGAGSVFQSRRPVNVSPVVSAGYQQLFGSLGFGIMILVMGESWKNPSGEGWLAWGYLVLFGSIVAFTAYITTIKLLPMKIAATYAYVNPVIAVFLGWILLQETVTLWTLGGAILVLFGVSGIFRERYRGTKVRAN